MDGNGIPGTRAFRKKISSDDPSSTDAPQETMVTTEKIAAPDADATHNDDPSPDAAVNRRAWLSSLVPALGDGLVKILRASNNLKDELEDIRRSLDDSTEKKE